MYSKIQILIICIFYILLTIIYEGCDTDNNTCVGSHSWLYGAGWTSTVSNASAGELWQVQTDGTISSQNGTADGFGCTPVLRPVITVSKTSLS